MHRLQHRILREHGYRSCEHGRRLSSRPDRFLRGRRRFPRDGRRIQSGCSGCQSNNHRGFKNQSVVTSDQTILADCGNFHASSSDYLQLHQSGDNSLLSLPLEGVVTAVMREMGKVSRLLSKRQGSAGCIAMARYARLRSYPTSSQWQCALLYIDGKDRCQFDRTKLGPIWIPLQVGSHQIHVQNMYDDLGQVVVELGPGQVCLVDIRPLEVWPFRRQGQGTWSVDVVE